MAWNGFTPTENSDFRAEALPQDMFAIGIILYRCVTAAMPKRKDSGAVSLNKTLNSSTSFFAGSFTGSFLEMIGSLRKCFFVPKLTVHFLHFKRNWIHQRTWGRICISFQIDYRSVMTSVHVPINPEMWRTTQLLLSDKLDLRPSSGELLHTAWIQRSKDEPIKQIFNWNLCKNLSYWKNGHASVKRTWSLIYHVFAHILSFYFLTLVIKWVHASIWVLEWKLVAGKGAAPRNVSGINRSVPLWICCSQLLLHYWHNSENEWLWPRLLMDCKYIRFLRTHQVLKKTWNNRPLWKVAMTLWVTFICLQKRNSFHKCCSMGLTFIFIELKIAWSTQLCD